MDKKTDHYFTQKPESAENPHVFTANVRGNMLTFHTSSSMFSPNRIDTGTNILIENAIVLKDTDVLDLGCGYGAVGLALAKVEPSIRLVMADVNERAIKLCRKNADVNNIPADVRQSDGFAHVPELFDTILLNPPQTAGKKLCEKLISESFEHLKLNGTLQLVARHQKGGREFEKFMQELFGNVEEVAKESGFRVYVGRRKKTITALAHDHHAREPIVFRNLLS